MVVVGKLEEFEGYILRKKVIKEKNTWDCIEENNRK